MPNFNFDERPVIEPVPVFYKDEEYEVREASTGAAQNYRNEQGKGLKLSNGKVSGLVGVGNLEPKLVASCLFKKKVTKEGSVTWLPISEGHISVWPSRLVRELYDWIKKVSLLNEPNTAKESLEKLLALPEAPCTFNSLQEFYTQQPEEEFESLETLLGADTEQTVKNL